MIRPDQIPPEVVEAAAKAIAESLRTARGTMESEDGYKPEARAAIAAALAAWPGIDYRPGAKVTKTWRDPGKIILPLPTEKSDD